MVDHRTSLMTQLDDLGPEVLLPDHHRARRVDGMMSPVREPRKLHRWHCHILPLAWLLAGFAEVGHKFGNRLHGGCAEIFWLALLGRRVTFKPYGSSNSARSSQQSSPTLRSPANVGEKQFYLPNESYVRPPEAVWESQTFAACASLKGPGIARHDLWHAHSVGLLPSAKLHD